MINRILVCAAILVLGAFGLQAQTGTTQSGTEQPGMQQQSGTQLSSTDQEFVKNAYQKNLAEIQLGQIAMQRASNSEVKQYAERMVNAHKDANEKLKQIAEEKGIELPTRAQMTPEQNELANLSGPEFDRQYIQHQVKAHEETVSLFQNEAQNGQDPAVKSFASNQLSNIQEHERIATDLSSKVAERSAVEERPSTMARTEGEQPMTQQVPGEEGIGTEGEAQQLPRTASNMPLVGLFGLMLIGAAVLLRSFRLLRNNR